MREIANIATNALAVVSKDGLAPMVEVILVLREPVYKVDPAGDVYRAEAVETVRFVSSAVWLRAVASKLEDIAAALDGDFKKALAAEAGKETASNA